MDGRHVIIGYVHLFLLFHCATLVITRTCSVFATKVHLLAKLLWRLDFDLFGEDLDVLLAQSDQTVVIEKRTGIVELWLPFGQLARFLGLLDESLAGRAVVAKQHRERTTCGLQASQEWATGGLCTHKRRERTVRCALVAAGRHEGTILGLLLVKRGGQSDGCSAGGR